MWGSDETLTIYTWWQTNTDGQDCEAQGGEACAARSLEQTYEECAHGSVKLVTLPSKNEALAELEANRGQPDGGIVNGKADVCRLVGDDISNPGLANLGTPEEPVLPFLSERTPPSLRNLVTCQGYQFGAILGLHRVNQLFYNTSITNRGDVNAALSERGIQFAETQSLKLDDLTLMLEALGELGYERPLLLGDDPTTWSRFLIENVMVAVAEEAAAQTNNPVDAYTDFWSELSKDTHTGGNYVNMVPFDAALERFEALSRYIQYVPSSSTSILKELNAHSDDAVFTVTGDWEEPHMPNNLAVRPFPGTEHAYVYTADVVVALPSKEPLTEQHPMASWLKAVTSEQAQTDYQRYKHSLDFLTLVDGHSQSKTDADLFTVDGKTLRGYQGLPAYIPHLTFDRLGSTIQQYMTCLVNTSIHGGSAAQTCAANKADLRDYVYDQYCTVISGSQDGCTEERPQWAQAQ